MTPSLFDLSGRTAVVVGGTSGIGRALALGLADAGANVVATGRRPEAVEDVSAAIEQRGRKTLRHPADVGEHQSLQRLRDACLAAFGHVDIVVAQPESPSACRRSTCPRPTGTGFWTPTSPACSGPTRSSRHR
jgi:glycerol-3-phosphate dehydrogenase